MYLMTAHRSFVGVGQTGELVQLPPLKDRMSSMLRLNNLRHGEIVASGPLSGYRADVSDSGTSFCKNGKYLCADYSTVPLTSREKALAWETFSQIPEASINDFIQKDTSDDASRFFCKVRELSATGEPVKIHCGAGPVPRPGFLNLDIAILAPNFFVSNREQYFIFPFISAWDIPDNCVDYIYHEDFIEHVTQIMQIQFLSEMCRVLKPGCWHRINTPDLIASMKRHSDFTKGFAGVYTGELQWGHIGLLSQGHLKELAKTIGYREIVFTTKNHGVSTYSVDDTRPGSDRDPITGNIYADLMK